MALNMYTKTDTVLKVAYRGRLFLVTKLSEVEDTTHTCDLLVIAPSIRVLLDVDIRGFKYLGRLQARSCRDLLKYKIDVVNTLKNKGRTRSIVNAIEVALMGNKEFNKEAQYVMVVWLSLSEIFNKELLDKDLKYNTLLNLPLGMLEDCVKRSSTKLLDKLLDREDTDNLIYNLMDIESIIEKYEAYISEISFEGQVSRSRLQGCYIGLKGKDCGYHFRNCSIKTLDNVEYGSKNGEYVYNRVMRYTELIEFDRLEDATDDEDLLSDLYGNIGNIILLSDLLYVINREELGKNLSFRECYILALKGIRFVLYPNCRHKAK